jgi:uncharacterized membrane protein
MKGVYALKKNIPLLAVIPALFLILFPVVLNSNTLSDFTKGSVAGLFIVLGLAAFLIIVMQLKGINLEQSKLRQFKKRLLRSK